MSVLSQMIRDREVFKRASLWGWEKTPAASHQNLGGAEGGQSDSASPVRPGVPASPPFPPVSVADRLHLPPNQAGEQRPGPGARQEPFHQPPQPDVDVVGMFVHSEDLLGDRAVPHDLLEMAQRPDALQSAEFPPGVVAWETTRRRSSPIIPRPLDKISSLCDNEKWRAAFIFSE